MNIYNQNEVESYEAKPRFYTQKVVIGSLIGALIVYALGWACAILQ